MLLRIIEIIMNCIAMLLLPECEIICFSCTGLSEGEKCHNAISCAENEVIICKKMSHSGMISNERTLEQRLNDIEVSSYR